MFEFIFIQDKDHFLERIDHLDDVMTFQEFELFTQLLNSLDDFAISVRIYSLAGKSLSREEFKRASKICLNGATLPDRVINMVFCLFDVKGNLYGKFYYFRFISFNSTKGDGLLGEEEFIVVMRNRLRRRLMAPLYPKDPWIKFKRCVRAAVN